MDTQYTTAQQAAMREASSEVASIAGVGTEYNVRCLSTGLFYVCYDGMGGPVIPADAPVGGTFLQCAIWAVNEAQCEVDDEADTREGLRHYAIEATHRGTRIYSRTPRMTYVALMGSD